MMIQRSILWYTIVFILLGGGVFQVKYTVLDLENTQKALRHAIVEQYERIHILKAEWAYLNDPARLQSLSTKYLALTPIQGSQIIPYADFENSGLGEYDRESLNSLLVKKGGKSSSFQNRDPKPSLSLKKKVV